MSQWPGLVGAGNDVERCFYRAFGFNTGMGWRDKERQAGRERAREREKKKNIESDINVEAGLRKLRCTGYQMCLTHKVLSE